MNDTITTKIQKEFSPAIDCCFSLCQKQFGQKMVACYIAGSVGTGEAWIGYSDIDWWVFIECELVPSDTQWRLDNENQLRKAFPAIKDFHLNCCSVSTLRNEPFWRFILKYNCMHFWGLDIVGRLEGEGTTTASPTPELVRSRLWFAKECAKGLCGGNFPDSLFSNAIPSNLIDMTEDNFQATRKLARNFILTEGSYLLMKTGHFDSFRANKVIPALRLLYPEWNHVYEMTEMIFSNPILAAISPKKYAETITPFVNWMISKMEN